MGNTTVLGGADRSNINSSLKLEVHTTHKNRLSQQEVVHAQIKNGRPTASVPETATVRLDVSSHTSKDHWEDDGSDKSDCAKATAVQALTMADNKSIASQQSRVTKPCSSWTRNVGQNWCGGPNQQCLERKIDDKTKPWSGSKNHDRYITERLGCTLWQDTDTRPMNRGGKETAF